MSASATIDDAARWLVDTPHDKRGPVVVELRKRFGLSAKEAVDAIGAANIIRSGGPAHKREN